jgi:Zn-dependent membrane protease YugP
MQMRMQQGQTRYYGTYATHLDGQSRAGGRAAMLIAVAAVLILLLLFLPQWWTRRVFRRYSEPVAALPGTGGELARHLLDRLDMQNIQVRTGGPDEDHYDPRSRTISLSPEVHDGKSLTAVAVAAHEVGHALQHKQGYGPLHLRWRLAGVVALSEKAAALMLVALPFAVALTRLPVIGVLLLVGGIGLLFLPVMFHLVTLPVELDASFNRALPILEKGRYLPESALPIARRILMAAAFTYVSASLASLLNFYRWIAILRR